MVRSAAYTSVAAGAVDEDAALEGVAFGFLALDPFDEEHAARATATSAVEANKAGRVKRTSNLPSDVSSTATLAVGGGDSPENNVGVSVLCCSERL